jgi:beta-lactamase class A
MRALDVQWVAASMTHFATIIAIMLTAATSSPAASDSEIGHRRLPPLLPSHALQSKVNHAVQVSLEHFADRGLRPNQLAVTVVDLEDSDHPITASHRGSELIYPASVVKLFYLVAVHQWLEDGRLQDTPELRRAMRDMVVHSHNDPTHYIIDLLTETTSGPELPDTDLVIWHDRRNAVNRYFSELGFPAINLNKKPWCEGPYGRESQAIQRFQPSRNWLSTDATAHLLTALFLDQLVSPARCSEMRELLRRNTDTSDVSDPQARFSGPALPKGAILWSKAGWTSETRHDAACVQLPNGRKVIMVCFTVDHAGEPAIIHTLVRAILEQLS